MVVAVWDGEEIGVLGAGVLFGGLVLTGKFF